jgi:hypothetical protein
MVKRSPLGKHRLSPLLALADLPADERLRLLKERTDLTLAQRARLGDTAAEDSLLSLFNAASTYDRRAPLIGQMGYVGSKRLLRHLIVTFNDPIFEEKGWALCTSIRLPTLKVFQRHHPGVPLLNSGFPEKLGDSASVAAYTQRFVQWARDTYGVVPEDDPPALQILKRGCSDCPVFNQRFLPDSLKEKAVEWARQLEAQGHKIYHICH